MSVVTSRTASAVHPTRLFAYESVAPAPVREPGRTTHIPALDGIRGLAILLVLLFHFSVVDSHFTGIRRAVMHLPAAGGSAWICSSSCPGS